MLSPDFRPSVSHKGAHPKRRAHHRKAQPGFFSGIRPTEDEIDQEHSPFAQALGIDVAVSTVSSFLPAVTALNNRIVSGGKTFLGVEVRVFRDGSVFVSLLPYPSEITYWRLECVKATLDEALVFIEECSYSLRALDLSFVRLFEVEAKHGCVSLSSIRKAAYVKSLQKGAGPKRGFWNQVRDWMARL